MDATTSEPAPHTDTRDAFARRRERFMGMIGEQAAALVVSNRVLTRSNDSTFLFRQSSDLWYLTGFEEPEAACLLLPGHKEHPFVMFVRKRDFKTEIWDGKRMGLEGAHEVLGADKVFAIEDLAAELPKLLVGRSMLVFGLGFDNEADQLVIGAYRKARRLARGRIPAPTSIVDPRDLLHEMRVIKTEDEIAAMREACRVSAEAHTYAMKRTRPGMAEYELQAEIEYHFMRSGAIESGYPSIVGGGPNACVLHYIENRDVLHDGDLVLVDAGAELGFYTGDVTRTWPVSGEFNGYQREVYDLVLRAQVAVIRSVRPGLLWNELHRTAVSVIAQGLLDMGILKGTLEEVIEKKTFRKFFMHGTGHWLGIDVHDVGAYARSPSEKGRPLEPGMVFTVEPGVYFHPEEEASPDDYRGIGVRIEDNVLVTENGYEVLTSAAPKEPEEIEAIVGTEA